MRQGVLCLHLAKLIKQSCMLVNRVGNNDFSNNVCIQVILSEHVCVPGTACNWTSPVYVHGTACNWTSPVCVPGIACNWTSPVYVPGTACN